jgi:regulatory protein
VRIIPAVPTKPPDTPLARARAIALRQLAARARTEAQIRAKLAREELGAEADAVVAWLRGLRYLDDGAYARARARGLVAAGRYGPRQAARRLVQEGIAPGSARAALAEALCEGGAPDPASAELTLCRALAARRARGRPLDALDDRERARLARFLTGRGFSGRAVAAALGVYEDGE